MKRPLVLAALLGSSLIAGPAHAQHGSWLMEYLSGWYSQPAMINADEPTTIVLWGWFPYTCGEVRGVVVDSSNVRLTLWPGPACADTATVWHQAFDLGLLPAGWHTLHVTRVFYPTVTDSGQLAEGSFSFYVEPSKNPPPAPHPCYEFPSVAMRGLSGWVTDPPDLNDRAPARLGLWGWFPYRCGRVTNAHVLWSDRAHVQLTLEPGPACDDTTLTWTHWFDLGILHKGSNIVEMEIMAVGDSCSTDSVRTFNLELWVTDEVVSASVPNPFVAETRFSVIQDQEGPVDVGIYDAAGRRVATLFQGVMPIGTHEVRWNGKRSDGANASIGVYFSRVAWSNRVVTRRLVMLPRR